MTQPEIIERLRAIAAKPTAVKIKALIKDIEREQRVEQRATLPNPFVRA